MKRIEDIKEFEDIDTYYEISDIVAEVFQDRVEAHKHLVTANKEIERVKEELEYTIPIVEHNKTITKHLKEIERLNNIINEIYTKALDTSITSLDLRDYIINNLGSEKE